MNPTHIHRISVSLGNAEVGSLTLTPERLCAFEYSEGWLKKGYSISPFELPLTAGVHTAKPTPFGGGFGVFDDSLPDGWGMMLLDRLLRSRGINPNSLSLLDLLAYVGGGGRGALQFRPDYGQLSEAEEADLREVERQVQQLLDSHADNASLETLWRQGGSPGGARPKVFVRYEGEEWLVKFPARYDPPDIGAEEYRYSLLARECGIAMSETRLFDGRFFGTKRFDRTPGAQRVHTVSAAGLLRADYRVPSLDYVSLIQLTQQLTHSEAEAWRMYSLMMFNYLIGNRDDHAKNFSFQRTADGWHLSPAYDLLPSRGFNGFHTTTFAGHVDPSDHAVLEVAEQCGLDPHQASHTLRTMQQTINNYADSH